MLTDPPRRSQSVIEALDSISKALEASARHRASMLEAGCGPVEPESSVQLNANKDLVRRFFDAIDSGVLDLSEYVAEGYVDHNPQFPDLSTGLKGVNEGVQKAHESWQDFQHELEEQVAEADFVVSRIRAQGKHTGVFLGFPPTGAVVTMKGITLHRIKDGRLVEHWAQIDVAGVLDQLVAASPPSTDSVPDTFKIKGKLDSREYHAPGGHSYDATIAEAYFVSAEAAEACGFTRAGAENKGQESFSDERDLDSPASESIPTLAPNPVGDPSVKTDTTLGGDVIPVAELRGKKVKPNDLKIVEGIGPKIEDLLKKAGVTTWVKLAETSGVRLKEILVGGGSRFQLHNPTSWPSQSALAATGKWKELEKFQDELDGGN